MRVVFQQADLDTCLAALILGVRDDEEVKVVVGDASDRDLRDPSVICIEAGGSGLTDFGNFDHHGLDAPRESACLQALARVINPPVELRRMVSYVAEVDGTSAAGMIHAAGGAGLSLSNIFSGMRLCVNEPVAQFREGVRILREVLRLGIDPVGPLPVFPAWLPYVERKQAERNGLEAVRGRIVQFVTASGLQAGFVESPFVGALGLLYEAGCEIGVAYSPHFQSPSGIGPVAKYSIGGRNGRRVDGMLGAMSLLEPGWGGPSHGTIIGSPRTGSGLAPVVVRRLVAALQ